MFKYLIAFVLIVSFFENSYVQAHSGFVKSYSQQSDWKKQEHKINLNLELDGQEHEHAFLILLNAEEMMQFRAEEGMPVVIVDEQPDVFVGQSRFHLQFDADHQVYEGKGLSIDLTPESWGVDDDSFMVTDVSLPNITLNGKESMSVYSITGNILGKVFSKHPVEQFIPDQPGISIFTYHDRHEETSFMYEGNSKESNWAPRPDQMGSIRTVAYNNRGRTGMTGPTFSVTLSDGRSISLPPSMPNIKVGNRWIQIGSGWVDLDDARFILDRHHSWVIRPLTKNW